MNVIIVLLGIIVAVLGLEPEADKCMTRLEAVLGQEPDADKCMSRLEAVLGQEPDADKCMSRLEAVLGQEPDADKCMSRLEAVEERLRVLEAKKLHCDSRLVLDVENPRVAFYTQLSKDITHIGDHQTIMFDTVTTNIGNGYNPADGIFTAPVTGTYVFFWLNTNKDHSYMNTELVKNNVVYGKSMSDAMDHSDYAAASNTAVLSITKGESVWIRSGTWHSNVIAGDNYLTFSDWLLYGEIM